MKELIPADKYGVFADTRDTARVNSLYVAQFLKRAFSCAAGYS